MNNNILGIPEDMEVLQLIINNENDQIGFLVMAEDFFEGSLNPLLKIYLLHKIEDEYVIQTEIEAFQFPDYAMAKSFNDRLPNMTVLEILLIMNGYEVIDSTEVNAILQ